MSNTVVVYYSKHGSTQQYAEWIAAELGADLRDAKSTKARDLAAYDTIVYGGGIYSGGIKGVELITKNWYKGLNEKKVVVFAVGVAVESEANVQQCLDINFGKRFQIETAEDGQAVEGQFKLSELLKEKRMPIDCFFLPGRLEPAGVKGLDKMILKFTLKLIGDGAKGESVEDKIVGYMTDGCDLMDRDRIRPIVEAAR